MWSEAREGGVGMSAADRRRKEGRAGRDSRTAARKAPARLVHSARVSSAKQVENTSYACQMEQDAGEIAIPVSSVTGCVWPLVDSHRIRWALCMAERTLVLGVVGSRVLERRGSGEPRRACYLLSCPMLKPIITPDAIADCSAAARERSRGSRDYLEPDPTDRLTMPIMARPRM